MFTRVDLHIIYFHFQPGCKCIGVLVYLDDSIIPSSSKETRALSLIFGSVNSNSLESKSVLIGYKVKGLGACRLIVKDILVYLYVRKKLRFVPSLIIPWKHNTMFHLIVGDFLHDITLLSQGIEYGDLSIFLT